MMMRVRCGEVRRKRANVITAAAILIVRLLNCFTRFPFTIRSVLGRYPGVLADTQQVLARCFCVHDPSIYLDSHVCHDQRSKNVRISSRCACFQRCSVFSVGFLP